MKYTKHTRAFVGITACSFFVCWGVLNAAVVTDQLKTTEFFLANSPSLLTSPINFPFLVTLGDKLTGIPNPVKSIYFPISGVYTGGGTMTLTLDGDATTTKTFTLPPVSAPTAFEFMYRDDVNYINPANSGTTSHTLNISPSGLSIFGFGIKNIISYRFAPPTCQDGIPANEKVKTSKYFVGSSPSLITGAINFPFRVSIGDNITGILNPVKSIYFPISGVYTGGGTMTLTLDGDATTTKTFTLPPVSAPTAFEFMYRDDVNYINPTVSGTYTHTLNVVASGISIAGLGVMYHETHRYKPEICVTYPATGEVNSAIFETTGNTNGPAYNSIMWKGVLGGLNADTGRVRFQFAASHCPNGATNAPACNLGVDSWNFIGGATCISGDWFDTPGISSPDTPIELKGASCIAEWNNKRYFRYKIQICSADDCVTSGGPSSPTISDVVINWAP